MSSTIAPAPSPSSPAPACPENWQEAGFGLYVHWPFCQAKCPYCDFNSHVAGHIDQNRWARAYEAEIARAGSETPGRILSTVFFGGGTPSLMAPETVAHVLEAVRRTWTVSNDLEVTLEANPGSVESARFRDYRAAGVTRISLGVQALNDDDLRRLGRLHDTAEALRALEIARATFSRVNFDLIYARQDQSIADWRAELGAALALGPDHLSLYQLTIEDGTAFGDRFRRGRLRGLPSEDVGADLFAVSQELCEAAGLPAYEVSNHAGAAARCRHNLIYWRSGDYVGIGPGAHGRLTFGGRRYATEARRAPGDWLAAVEHVGSGECPRAVLPQDEAASELLLMGLRLDEGVSLSRHLKLAGEISHARARHLIDDGFIEIDRDRLRVTARGRPLLDAVLTQLA